MKIDVQPVFDALKSDSLLSPVRGRFPQMLSQPNLLSKAESIEKALARVTKYLAYCDSIKTAKTTTNLPSLSKEDHVSDIEFSWMAAAMNANVSIYSNYGKFMQ